MTTTTDANHRPTAPLLRPGAPAWVGDLTTLTNEELSSRIEALAVHIGNLHTVWVPREAGGPLHQWRTATAADLAERQLPRWVSARLTALGERERRIEAQR